VIKYAITDPSFFTTYEQKSNYLNRVDANYVLFRDKLSRNYAKDAYDFLKIAQNRAFKKIIHQDYYLAKELNADGVHLTSKQFNDIKYAKELGLLTIISTHKIDEIKKAKELGADIVTFSPIFPTPNKGEPKGLEGLRKAIECCDMKILALGGIITKEHIKKIEALKPYGFASIRYFIN